MKQFKIPITILVFILSLIILYFLKVESSASVWKGYRILTVRAAVSEGEVLRLLQEAGLQKAVTLSGNTVRASHPLAPVQLTDPAFENRRKLWFTDPTGNYRFFYLQDSPLLRNAVQKAFRDANFFWNLEDFRGFSWLLTFPALLMTISGFFLGNKRVVRLLLSVPFVLLSFSCNTKAGSLSSLYALFSIQLFSTLLDTGFFLLTPLQLRSRLLSKPLYGLGYLAAALLSLTSGPNHLVLFLAASAAAASAVLLFIALRPLLPAALLSVFSRPLHPLFRPVPMHPLSITAPVRMRIFLVSSISLFLGVALTLIPASLIRNGGHSTVRQDLSIPVPSGYTASGSFSAADCAALIELREGQEPTNLADYVVRQWVIHTFPYIPVYRQTAERTPEPGETVTYTDYRSGAEGTLEAKIEQVLMFNDQFVRKVLNRSEVPELEKMLLSQGRFVRVSFAAAPTQFAAADQGRVSLFLLFLLFPAAGILVRLKK